MAEHSAIEWTDATWNPITGCSVVSPGCTNCYAMRLAGTRMKHHPSREGLTTPSRAGPVWNGLVRLNEAMLGDPLRWRRGRRIFVCAHGDLFHESVPDEWIDRVFAVMASARQHTFQVLTKRASRMRAYLTAFGEPRQATGFLTRNGAEPTSYGGPIAHGIFSKARWPLPNVWLGVSAENQRALEERLAHLSETPAAVRFVSAEPLLGPLNFRNVTPHDAEDIRMDALTGNWRTSPRQEEPHLGAGIDWIIAGGESGPGARPMHPAWARRIRDDCAAAGVPFFFKQWGDWAPVCAIPDTDCHYHPAPAQHPEASRRCKVDHLVLHADGSQHRGHGPGVYAAGSGAMMCMAIGKKAAGRLLDGVEHDAMPV